MNRFTSIALCLSFSTAAIADGRDATSPTTGRDSGSSSTSADTSSSSSTSPFSRPTTGSTDSSGAEDAAASDTVEVSLLGSGKGFRGAKEYDFDVSGETYTVSVNNTSRASTLSLYNAESELVVGYVASDRGAAIFDEGGIVERGTASEVDMSILQDYGSAATLLTNPIFLSSALEANGEDFWGGDDPPAMWWVGVAYLILRCVDVSASYSSGGDWSVEAGIDC